MAHQMPMETQQELRRLPGNNRCVDCNAPYPQWATVSYGTFMCLECSGRHRGLGVHISFVRSVTMDSWTDKQVLQMQKGGNDNFRTAFSAAGVPADLSISEKYNAPQAEAYRQRLTAVVEGRAPPSLPQWDPSMRKPASSSFSSASYSGGGSAGGDTRGVEALKGESEQDYVARQVKLREEARARMAAKFGAGGMQGIGSGGETRAPQAPSGGLGDISGAFSYFTSTVTTAASSAASLVKDQDLGSKVSSSWSYVQSAIHDPALSDNVKSSATSGWSVLSSGASALLQTAQTAVNGNGNVNGNSNGMNSAFPRTNAELSATGKYAGMGSNSSSTSSSSRDHDNDSWLDSQLGSSSSNHNSGSFYTPPQQSKPAQTSDLFGSSSSSTNGSNHDLLGLSSSSVGSATSNGSASAMTAPVAAAPPPAPVVQKEKPKDVDFFGEFGF
ncbi:putative ADP-ribosylation factor GTPase-activating protein AGD6 [Phytophthora ramorum]|uniref:putative ADP-ribosylation factor GTPase-activating protein AGD6 n=1 Tax=Phytophthora ramorum TaxID=164328 RepID=UPI00309A5F09|nr:putative ADP-ribosylation factor GTPase-activating protein AGD6 [Phytophthora ramorum]